MESKTIILIFLTIGSAIGGSIPLLWGSSAFSGTSVLFSTAGGIFGIYVGYKISHY